MMNFVLSLMNFVLNLKNFVSNLMNFVLEMIDCIKNDGFALKMDLMHHVGSRQGPAEDGKV